MSQFIRISQGLILWRADRVLVRLWQTV